jgi:hypothetical protein
MLTESKPLCGKNPKKVEGKVIGADAQGEEDLYRSIQDLGRKLAANASYSNMCLPVQPLNCQEKI